MRKILIPVVAATLLAALGCQKKPESETVTVTTVDGVPTVHNPAHPLRDTCPWQYVEDLVISNEMADPETSFVYVGDLAADSEGNIYVADPRQKRVQVFDPRGRYLRSIGKPGEGPGEFSRPGSIRLDSAGHLMIYDYQLRRVSWFDRSGHFLRSVALEKLGWPSGILPWAHGRFLAIISRPQAGDPSARWYRIAVLDTSGQQVDSLGTFFAGRVKRIPIKGGVVTYFTGYEPSLAWDVAPGPLLYVGYSGHYGIDVYDDNGNLVRRIERAWTPAPIPEEKRREALNRFIRVPKEVKDQIEVPKTEPAFYDILCDDLGYLWVRRTSRAPHRFDIFDPDGRFVCILSLDCAPLAWSGGYLYGRRFDSESGSTELVRFRRAATS